MPLIPPNRVTAFPLKDDLYWYDPDVLFQPFDDIFGRGVIGSTDLQVVANATPDGQISVQPGRGYVPYQSGGKRLFRTTAAIRSDAAEFQHAIGAYTGTPRVDRVVAKILDATLNPPDALKGGVFDVLPGVPTSGASLANLSGAASVPSTAMLIGNVLVNGATIPNANIDSTFGTVRARARIGAGNSPAKGVQVNGATMTDRTNVNLIAGAGIGISGTDNSGADSSDITISNTQPSSMDRLYDVLLAAPQNYLDTNRDTGALLLPQTYSTLVIRLRVQSTASQADTVLNMWVNNDATANYDDLNSFMDGQSGANMSTQTGATSFQPMRFNAATVSNGWGVFEITCYHYTAASRMQFFGRGADTASQVNAGKLLRYWSWMGNYHGTGINRVAFGPGAGNFATGSRMTVWGIV